MKLEGGATNIQSITLPIYWTDPDTDAVVLAWTGTVFRMLAI